MKTNLFSVLLIVLSVANVYETADTVRLLRSDMPEDMRIQATGIFIDELKNNHTLDTIANKLAQDFATVYGGQWFSFACAGEIAGRFGVTVPNTLLWFSYGNTSVVLFKSYDCRNSVEEANETLIIDQVRRSAIKTPIVIKSEMTDATKARAINVTVEAFNAHLTFQQIAAKIATELNAIYGPQWHSSVGVRVVESSDEHENGTYLSFNLVNAAIVLFKSKSSAVGLSELEVIKRSKNSIINELYANANHAVKSGIYDLAKQAVNQYDDFGEIETFLKENLQSKYGGNWLTIITVKAVYTSNWDPELSLDIILEFDLGDTRFYLYQDIDAPQVNANTSTTANPSYY